MPTNNLQIQYNQLNESRKAELRAAFCDEYEFSRDSFYKKINGETSLKNFERKFFCNWFNIEMEILFPFYESVK